MGQKSPEKIFSLYLLPDRVQASQLDRLDLKRLKPYGKPLITIADVMHYLKDTHEITLGSEAGRALKNLKVPSSGKPFVVFAGDEAIYAGAFWRGFTPPSLKGVAVDLSVLKGDFPTLKFELDYTPLSPKNAARDPRFDELIFKAFERGGFLYEELWLTGRCLSIRATGKRLPSWIFAFAVSSVRKGKFAKPEIVFEVNGNFRGGSLLNALEVNKFFFGGTASAENFNRRKEFLLKFERRVKPDSPQIILRSFETQ